MPEEPHGGPILRTLAIVADGIVTGQRPLGRVAIIAIDDFIFLKPVQV